ncbi:MAG: hypothetical protein M3N16_01110 [Actinomycetota bacterium]|nr:hypothetical protein [Actinomycetota bacterium]
MPRFTVETPQLGATAASLDLWASQLGAARAALARVEPAGGAADHPPWPARSERFVEAWSQTAIALDEGTRGLATNLGASAGAYVATDERQFPGR